MPVSELTNEILKQLNQNFSASTAEIIDRLASRGVTAKPQDVYRIKSEVRKNKHPSIQLARPATSAPVVPSVVAAPVVVAAAPHPDADNYHLLRQAVVDFARNKGLNNPDDFPDTLIKTRRELIAKQEEYNRKQEEYSRLFSNSHE